MMEARNYTSSESDGDGRSKRVRKKEKRKGKKTVEIVIDRDTASDESEEAIIFTTKSRQSKRSDERKKKEKVVNAQSSHGQSVYQQPTGPGLPQHHGFIPGVAYPIPDSGTGR
jgi:hypothetical protein